MRIVVLASDGFGGHGGAALYARNVLAVLTLHPASVAREIALMQKTQYFGRGWLKGGLRALLAENLDRARLRRQSLFCPEPIAR